MHISADVLNKICWTQLQTHLSGYWGSRQIELRFPYSY